jgi:hypothetical protein
VATSQRTISPTKVAAGASQRTTVRLTPPPPQIPNPQKRIRNRDHP